MPRPLVSLIALALLMSCAPVATPSHSPSVAPTSAAPTASLTPVASPSPTATATADAARYGVLLGSGGRISVRSETTFATSVYAAGGEHAVASHDGRRIAFWRTGPQGNNPQELRIADIPSGNERMLTSLPAGFAGGALVWSSADDGLFYEVHSTASFPGAGGGPRSSRLESYDLLATQAPGATDGSLMLTDGRVFIPLAWDRSGALSSALTTGEGGYAIDYVTWDRRVLPAGQNATKLTRFPWPVIAGQVNASHDAKRLLAVDLAANAVRVWPLADIGSADIVRAGAKLLSAQWRKGVASDISWVVGSNVDVFTYQTSTVATWYEGQAPVTILAWRVDGSGIVLFESARGTFVVPGPRQSPLQLFDQDAGVAGTVLVR